MRKYVWLCALVLLFALPAAAQDFSRWSEPANDRAASEMIRISNGNATMTVSPHVFELDPLPVNTTTFAAAAPLSSGLEAPVIASSGVASLLAPPTPPRPKARPAPEDWGNYKNWFGFEFAVLLVRESFGTGRAETFPHYGFDLAYVRWLNAWIGLEGSFGALWGDIFGIDSRIFYYMGGFRLAGNRGGRLVPWAHFLGGGATADASGVPSENSATFRVGGGLNVNWTAHVALKLLYVGYVYSRIGGDVQHNILLTTGLYLNF